VARAAAGDDATISAVNYSEVLQKAARVGIAAEEIDAALDELAITITPFGRLQARLAASFYRHKSDLSLADRVCLALGRSLSSATYTSDRSWLNWADDLGVHVVVSVRHGSRPPPQWRGLYRQDHAIR
jgi:ribonuclease VapC